MKSDANNPNSISAKARKRRIKQFVHALRSCNVHHASVLDIGGRIDFWKMNLPHIPNELISRIEIVNLPPQEDSELVIAGVSLKLHAGDALDKNTFEQNKYDIIFLAT